MTTGLLTPTHIAILLIVALLILGPKRLPQTGRALGQSIREFKDSVSGLDITSAHPELKPGQPDPVPGSTTGGPSCQVSPCLVTTTSTVDRPSHPDISRAEADDPAHAPRHPGTPPLDSGNTL
jgi:sec-independent protein translocase protein TatA